MKSIAILERLNIYFRSLKQYVLGLSLYFLFITAYSYFTQVIVDKLNYYPGLLGIALNSFIVVLILVVPFYLIANIHITIGRSLFRNTRKELILTLPIFIVWTFTISFKIYVNEAIFYDFGGYGGYGWWTSQNQRLLNYFLFTLWTAIFWWEVYYRVLLFFQRKKHNRAQ
jgi:hypothetical protein